MTKAIAVTISMYPDQWYAFKVGCVVHRIEMSKMLRQLIDQQLDRWQTESRQHQHEDHAHD